MGRVCCPFSPWASHPEATKSPQPSLPSSPSYRRVPYMVGGAPLLVPTFAVPWGGGRKMQESPVYALKAPHRCYRFLFPPAHRTLVLQHQPGAGPWGLDEPQRGRAHHGDQIVVTHAGDLAPSRPPPWSLCGSRPLFSGLSPAEGHLCPRVPSPGLVPPPWLRQLSLSGGRIATICRG